MLELEAEFFRPFVDGVRGVLRQACRLEAVAGKPFLKGPTTDQDPPVGIAGVIALRSAEFNGSVSICFEVPVLLRVVERILGEPCQGLDETAESGAAELLNMVFGQAKSSLNAKGHAVQMARPAVVKGRALHGPEFGGGGAVVIPFELGAEGQFRIEIRAESPG